MHDADPEPYPATIWANWLCGDHKPNHRRRVLTEFADGIATDGTVVEKGFLSSVKVLGEGVDTRECDSVYFADVRGSMPDLVQAVGRALRMQPGERKTASHGHLLAPLDATHQGYKVGIFLKNARAATRRGIQAEQRQAERLPVKPTSA
ncbi:helicase-related protein [Streptomyces coeruleorubidus]|uniref:helicase-related protein n=1 Tax=Streptomyces coeruleorubidus TaxID=116188 RepID=UPI00368F6B79